ncbi:ankyrin repeat and KH domain-containing protein 1-like isoform X4 [Hordeum vulgare subsp. vulgare]|uniref:ankyrin repeat and KH domain-containing protein 1-like isoform X4 n=1 Tax=Hordeum vulgare subsp. vulgare TaxID=112509 RepID=UPI001D1A44CD|nr:ankyrin repeat and KH domain-containing protein 1-like isoform X4 [Hordeum vulgare subsp. vulgare]
MASSPSSIDAALKKPAKKVGLRRAKAADVETMLHFASRQCCLVSCRFLVEGAGLDVNSESKTGVTPIFLAALQGNVQITRDHVGDPAMPDEKVSMPLYNAAVAGHCESVRLLLSKGRHVDPICYRGTLLHLAAVKDHDQVVMVLLEHGADPNKAAHHVFSRLVMTYCGKSLKCMRLLIEAGADVSARKCSGPTPLMEAVDDGLTDFAKVLPDGGANLNISNQHGAIPIKLAAASGRHKLVQILFPGTKPIPSLPDWSVDGIIKTVNSPKINSSQIGNAGLDVPRAAGQTMKAIVELLRACSRKEIAPPRKETVMERPPSNSHGSKILFILFAAVFIILLIFILYLWWVRRAAQGRRDSLPLMKIQKQARSSPGSGGRRQSSGRLKERRPSGQ